MIIDSKKVFAKRNTVFWYQKQAGNQRHTSGKVISLRPQSKSVSGPALASEPDILTSREITLLRNSASLLVTHHHEIAVQFYRKVLKTMWWNHDRFGGVVACEKKRLLSALLILVVRPTETSLIAFFLADNWVKYHIIGDVGNTYDNIACYLNDAIEEVLREYFTPELSAVWRKVLAPGHVFNGGLDANTEAISESEISRDHK